MIPTIARGDFPDADNHTHVSVIDVQPSNAHEKTDGTSPIDALRIINFINLHGSQSGLTAASVDTFFDGSMLDTNNDGSITPIDALLVLNRLNLENALS